MKSPNNKVVELLGAMLAYMMFCFAPLVQAEPIVSTLTFDHSKTGFLLRDVHTTLRCEQCHVDGIFKNTPKECAGCHSIGSRVGATPKPVNHVQTNFACDTCHVSPTSFLVRRFNHFGVLNSCSSCHNGQSLGVVSKPASHFPTFLPCENCHLNTNTFLSSRMDHSGITSACVTCHGGQSAGVKSMPAMHIPTSGAGCETCHNTSTFLGAMFNHSAAVPPVAGRCSQCHGIIPNVKAKSAGHMLTSAQCDTCHTQAITQNYTTFLGAVVNHALFTPPITSNTQNCSQCHNGVAALGKPAWHIATTAECGVSCHTTALGTMSFLGASAVHTPAYVGICQTCHNGAKAKGPSAGHIQTGGISCDGCHAMYNPPAVISFASATMSHTLVTGTSCYSCHNGSFTAQGTMGAKAMPINHIPTAITGSVGGLPCTTCHTNPIYTSATGWAGVLKINHNGAMGMGAPIYCVTCHLTGNTYLTAGTSIQMKNHNGSSMAKDCSSASCHKPLGRIGTAYTRWN